MTKTAYKTMWVKAEMKILKEKIKKKRQIGTGNVTKTKGFFITKSYEVEEPIFEEYDDWVPTGEISLTQIDIEGFSQKIMNACNTLSDEGYDIVHVSDIIAGKYQFDTKERTQMDGGWAWGYGYGYSITDGVVITAKLKNV